MHVCVLVMRSRKRRKQVRSKTRSPIFWVEHHLTVVDGGWSQMTLIVIVLTSGTKPGATRFPGTYEDIHDIHVYSCTHDNNNMKYLSIYLYLYIYMWNIYLYTWNMCIYIHIYYIYMIYIYMIYIYMIYIYIWYIYIYYVYFNLHNTNLCTARPPSSSCSGSVCSRRSWSSCDARPSPTRSHKGGRVRAANPLGVGWKPWENRWKMGEKTWKTPRVWSIFMVEMTFLKIFR